MNQRVVTSARAGRREKAFMPSPVFPASHHHYPFMPGDRTCSGGAYTFQIPGPLAARDNVAIPIKIHDAASVRCVFAYPSISYLYEAAEAIAETEKPAYLHYFGDYDPSGCDITRAVESGIREFAPEAEIHFERLAVTREQIAAWSLPCRPTRQSDSRSEGFDGDSVEVDSIPPARLRELVRNAITRHIDPHQMAASLAIEEQERETLRHILGNLGRAA